ncbi:MAG: DUF4377 domain-containing protein [Myxococcota bacterium]|nr:DUF4377 domain-containing protein [Myxococcota bacterium]
MLKLVVFVLVALIPLGCSLTRDEVEYDVAPHRVPCYYPHTYSATCLAAKVDGSSNYQTVHFGILGFDHQWGTASKLRVERVKLDDPPADGSSIELHLLEVVSTTPAEEGLAFSWVLNPAWYFNDFLTPHVHLGEDGQWQTMDGHPFTCASQDVCSTLERSLVLSPESPESITLHFQFQAGGSLSLMSVEGAVTED